MPAWGMDKNVLVAQIGGEAIKFTVKDTRRVTGDSQWNLKRKSGENLGYYYEIETTEGKIVRVATWGLVFALERENVDVGDTVSIQRPSRGVYIVKRKPREASSSPALDYLEAIKNKHAPQTNTEAEW